MALRGILAGNVVVKTDAATFHDIFSYRPHQIRSMSPARIISVDLHEGQWGAIGTLVTWNYEKEGVHKKAKERIEAVDDKNLSVTYRVLEGDLMKEYKDFTITVKATPKPNGGAIVHWILEYEKLHEGIPDPHYFLGYVLYLSKDIDDHHVAQAK